MIGQILPSLRGSIRIRSMSDEWVSYRSRCFEFCSMGSPRGNLVSLWGDLMRSTFSDKAVTALVDAMVQVLDDMGIEENCCTCLATKVQARIAIEPFIGEDEKEFLMPFSEAEKIWEDIINER